MVLPPTPLQNVLQCCDSSSNAIVKRSVLYVSINLCCAGSVCWYYGLHVCRQKYINIIQPQFYASVFTTSHMVFHCKTLVYSEWHDQKMCNTNMAYNKISDSTKCRCGKIIWARAPWAFLHWMCRPIPQIFSHQLYSEKSIIPYLTPIYLGSHRLDRGS